ncbi:MAG: type II secretion system F family protein [Anaerolineaceae bacterium]|nr:type II secretion system F family protein [Anaerolineaceae bacterium]
MRIAFGFSVQVYRMMLQAYPKGFRDLYQDDMLLDFRDALSERQGWGVVGFWVNTMLDLMTSAANERLRNISYRSRAIPMTDTTLFNNQLASTLDFWSRLLRGGYSVKQILELAAKHAPEPTAGLIRETLAEAEESGSLIGAIARMPERLDSPYLQQVVQLIMHQREIDGNLADMLDDLNNGMRPEISGDDWAGDYDYNDGKS